MKCQNWLGNKWNILGLSSSICSISTSFIGRWIQPGLGDLITINNTWFSLKGTCLSGQHDVKNKFIYYNEWVIFSHNQKMKVFFVDKQDVNVVFSSFPDI
jgi:hypothetical protein